MKYDIWGNETWEHFAYKQLLESFPGGNEFVYRGKGSPPGSHEPIPVRFAPAVDLDAPRNHEYAAIVCSPFWIHQALGSGYSKVFFIMEPCPAGVQREVWEKYSGLLAEAADLIITGSEKIYLEQCLRRRNVVWWDAGVVDSGENQRLVGTFVERVFREESLEPCMREQWKQRIRAYCRLREDVGNHETISYLLASYHYFLGEQQARELLLQSFETVLLREHNGTLHSHYRFLSAMEAQQGQLERAVYTYAITAVLPEEKEALARMERWAAMDRFHLLEAELYLANDDFAAAERAALEDASEEAEHFLIDLYLRQWMWKKGLRFMERLHLKEHQGLSIDQIRATLLWIRNQKHEAVTQLLRASLLDWNMLLAFAENDLILRGCEQMKERLNHEAGSEKNTQSEG